MSIYITLTDEERRFLSKIIDQKKRVIEKGTSKYSIGSNVWRRLKILESLINKIG